MENDIKNVVTTTETVENVNQETEVKDKMYSRDEINKMINAEKW